WLSLKNAIIIVNVLRDSIIKLDSNNSSIYKKNAENYTLQLSKLDSEYKTAVTNGKYDSLLFADRFPFRYLVDDYGLKYYAAFIGCSAESEASFETIAFLVNKVNELNLKAVLTIEKSDKKIARTVVSNSKNKKCEILEMNSLQSVSKNEIKAGLSYLETMKKNLEVLKKALAQ
ncbi:MAG: zinc ABC transporter substrate-binding protein, partial [Treponema sp.]|nr:zinc ABC transporter substrate-binding protein [Treponema sp.]